MADTSIEWADVVWNPSTGCDRVSPGCDHCYAMTLAKRLKAMGSAKYQRDGNPRTSGPGFGVSVHADALALPLSWRKPRRIFVNSMSDLFHDDVPDDFIASVFAVMALAEQHTFQVLTKRHGRMRSLLSNPDFQVSIALQSLQFDDAILSMPWPLRNVWLGVSVENQQRADIRIPALLETPAAVRWISAEPLLGPVELKTSHCPEHDFPGGFCTFSCPQRNKLAWVVLGGESGPGARPMELAWAESLVEQCQTARVPVFVKQLGSRWGKAHHDINLFPGSLQVREFPVSVSQRAEAQ